MEKEVNVNSKVQNQPYVNPTPGEISLVGLGLFQTSDEKGNKIPGQSLKAAQLLKEIGCNASQAQVNIINNGPEFTGFRNSLESCAEAGIKMLPMLGMVDGNASKVFYSEIPESYDRWVSGWGQVAAKYKDYPALGGWFMGDELTAVVMEVFAKAKAEILKNDSSHVALANLYGKYSIDVEGDPEEEHKQLNGIIEPSPEISTPSTVPDIVNNFSEYYYYFDDVFGPAIWLTDLYPFGLGGGSPALDPKFYKYLLDMKTISSRTGRPFWTYVASNIKYPAVNGSFAGAATDSALTIGRLRFQVFMALAYGAQGINYWNIFYDYGKYNLSPVDKDGNKTVLFDIIKTVNQEVKAYNLVFCGCNVSYLGVVKNASLDDDNELLPMMKFPYEYLKSVTPSGYNRWICSKIDNAGNKYVVFVNTDYQNMANLNIEFMPKPYTIHRMYKNGTFSSPIMTFNENILPGDVVIFKVNL